MKKPIILVAIYVLISTLGLAQKPQEIQGIAKENHPQEYYEEQVQLWENEIELDSKNANAYFQNYKAQRAFLQLSQADTWKNNKPKLFAQLKPIIALAKKNVGNSYEYHIMEAYNERSERSYDFLEKAYTIDPERKETYGELLIKYVLGFQYEKAKEIAQRMLERNIYSNASLQWNLNTMNSLDANSIFICNGDLDTMPKWVLHFANAVRSDVLFISKWSMINDLSYRKKIFEKIGIKNFDKHLDDFESAVEYTDYMTAFILKNSPRPAYVGVGTPARFFKSHAIDDKMYVVGTAVKYSTKGFDNHAETVNNFENEYHLEYLLSNYQSHHEDEAVKKHMNVTYLPGLVTVKKHFKKNGNDAKLNYYQSIIDKIARESGREDEIKKWFKH